MNNKGVTFTVPGTTPPPVKNPTFTAKSLTASLSEFNRPKCGCGKSKTGYCDGSHSLPSK